MPAFHEIVNGSGASNHTPGSMDIILSSFLIFLFVIFVFTPVVINSYAFSDDYFAIYHGMNDELRDVMGQIVAGGRPVYALFYYYAFHVVKCIADLRWLRAIGVSGIGAVAMVTYLTAIRSSLPRPAALAIALLVGLMPPFQVCAAWAVAAFYPWAAVLAFLAFRLIDGGSGASLGRSAIFGFFLLVGALAIYQPASTMFWFCAGLCWLCAPTPPVLARVGRACLVMLGALFVDYGLARLLPYIHGVSAPAARESLVTDIPSKIWWFIRQPLLDAVNLPFIRPNVLVGCVVGGAIVAGFWLWIKDDRNTRWTRVVLALALLPLSYLPNLVVREDWASYRTQIGLISLVLLYEAIAVSGWLRSARLERYTPIFAICAVVACAGLAARNVITEFVRPQVREYQLIEASLVGRRDIVHARNLYLTPAPLRTRLAVFACYDEFGIPSSHQPWAVQGIAWLVLRDLKSPAAALVAASQVGSARSAPAGYTVVDFGKALGG